MDNPGDSPNRRNRAEEACAIAMDWFVASLRDPKLKEKNRRIIEFLATDAGRGALRRILAEARASEIETIKRAAEFEGETVKIDIPSNCDLKTNAVFRRLYNSNKNTLARFGFLDQDGSPKEGCEPLPELTEVRNTFTNEEIETANTFIQPSLILVPSASFSFKIEAINSKKGEGARSLHAIAIPDSANESYTAQHNAGWKAYIVEKDIHKTSHANDDPYAVCADRINNYSPENGVLLSYVMDCHLHIMLMMECIRKGLPLSVIGKKVLLCNKGNPQEDNVIVAFCGSGNLIYKLIPASRVAPDACIGPRFVGGRIIGR